MHQRNRGVLVLFLLVMVGCASERPGGVAGSHSSGFVRSFLFTTIALDRPAYFPTAEGATLLLPVGQYIIDSVDDAHLRLSPEDATAPLVIAAALQAHEIDIPVPLVLAFSEKEDEPHVVLLLPNGRALDATGSFSGIQSREIIRPHRRYTFQTGTGALRFTEETIPLASDMGKSPSVATTKTQSQLGTVEMEIKQLITEIDRLKEEEDRAQSRTKELEEQNAPPYGRQRVISTYSQAQALAQSTLATLSAQFQLEFNTDRPGGDYAQRAEATPEACRVACASDHRCQAFTFVKPPVGSSTGRCFLKQTVPTPVGNACCISAKGKSAQEELVGSPIPPPKLIIPRGVEGEQGTDGSQPMDQSVEPEKNP